MSIRSVFPVFSWVPLGFSLGFMFFVGGSKGTLQRPNSISITPEISISQDDFRGNSRFVRVKDVEADSKGNIYLLDDALRRIFKFDAYGKYLFSFGKGGRRKGELTFPSELIIDGQDNVWVLDGALKRASIFNQLGEYLYSFQVDLRYPGFDLRGVLGSGNQLILSGYRNGRIFHIYDTRGKLVRSFGEALSPFENEKYVDRIDEAFFTAVTLFYRDGFLFHTQWFKYEVRKYDVSSGKLVSIFSKSAPRWWRNPIMTPEGGLQFLSGSSSILVMPQGTILNFLSDCDPQVPCRYFLQILTKDGKFMGIYQVNYWAVSVDKNGKLYCIRNGLPWTVLRCTIDFLAN